MNEASTQTKPTGPRARPCLSHRIASAAFLAILLLALFFRCGGLYRGLNSRHYCYHPDSPKQIAAASKFMTGQYIWYTGSWFYDGYPYGLNHVDALLLRPILAVRDGARRLLAPGAEQQKCDFTLYHWIRLLRVFYGMLCALLVYLTCRLLHLGRVPSLFASAVVGLSPLAISVSHTATGDIGVDLFVSLLMLALAFHVDYWDYLGWKDRFSSADYTKRQRLLGANNLQRTIYTPEFFVNGMEARGSGNILDKIQQTNQKPAPLALQLIVSRDKSELVVALQAPAERAAIGQIHHRYLVYENNLSTDVKRGENSGEVLHHQQVVRYMSPAQSLQTENQHRITIDPDWQSENIGIAVLVTSPGDRHYLQAVHTPVASLLAIR